MGVLCKHMPESKSRTETKRRHLWLKNRAENKLILLLVEAGRSLDTAKDLGLCFNPPWSNIFPLPAPLKLCSSRLSQAQFIMSPQSLTHSTQLHSPLAQECWRPHCPYSFMKLARFLSLWSLFREPAASWHTFPLLCYTRPIHSWTAAGCNTPTTLLLLLLLVTLTSNPSLTTSDEHQDARKLTNWWWKEKEKMEVFLKSLTGWRIDNPDTEKG